MLDANSAPRKKSVVLSNSASVGGMPSEEKDYER